MYKESDRLYLTRIRKCWTLFQIVLNQIRSGTFLQMPDGWQPELSVVMCALCDDRKQKKNMLN